MKRFFQKSGLVILSFLFKVWVLIMISGPLTILIVEEAQWRIWWFMIIVCALADTVINYKNAWIFLKEENNE